MSSIFLLAENNLCLLERRLLSYYCPSLLDTPVPICTLKLRNIEIWQYLVGDCLGTPGAAGMGLDIDAVYRGKWTVSNPARSLRVF